MSDIARWELISEREGSSGFLDVVAREYRFPDGTRGEWDIFGPEQSVAIFAVTAGDEIVIARQYRPGPDAVLDELPGGLVEPGEDVADAAARELLEETGYAGDISVVAAAGSRVRPEPGGSSRWRSTQSPSPNRATSRASSAR